MIMGTKFRELYEDPNFLDEDQKKRIDRELERIINLFGSRKTRSIPCLHILLFKDSSATTCGK